MEEYTTGWVFFNFFKLYKKYQIAQNITYSYEKILYKHSVPKIPFVYH